MTDIALSICVFFACVIVARLLVRRAQNNDRLQLARARIPELPKRRR